MTELDATKRDLAIAKRCTGVCIIALFPCAIAGIWWPTWTMFNIAATLVVLIGFGYFAQAAYKQLIAEHTTTPRSQM